MTKHATNDDTTNTQGTQVRLRQWVQDSPHTLDSIALGIGVHRSTLYRCLYGEVCPPDHYDNLVKFGVPAELLPLRKQPRRGRPLIPKSR